MTFVFDTEVYKNFFLALFKSIESGEVVRFQISRRVSLNREHLQTLLENNRIVGFNSHNFDIPMLQLALLGFSAPELKWVADKIIIQGKTAWDIAEEYNLEKPTWNHIDLIEVAPLKASLKLYGGRLHCKKMQDLPIDPGATVTPELVEQLYEYCCNDLEVTALLLKELDGQIKLRESLSEKYGIDLRSRSDAQIAERAIGSEIAKVIGFYPRKPEKVKHKVKYDVPANVRYETPRLRMLLDEIREATFTLNDNGSVIMPDCLNTSIRLAGGVYRMGIGGLHSSETRVFHVADTETLLIDRDVASYYPSIILNQQLFPSHLGPGFLDVYRGIVEQRLAAKKAGDKVSAESLKITINGSFGKFGSKWSVLYSPQLLIQVTVSGQLYLLMLIEMIEASGIPVISANTDGIMVKCPRSRYDDLSATIAAWEQITGFATEETQYRAVYSRDVNNYLAIKQDGSTKGKGAFANPWEKEGPNIFKFHKNPQTTVCIEAVTTYLANGVPLEETIKNCRDVRKFISVRKVSGGAKDSNGFLGKAVR
ncbi:MAG: hypothetical protein ACREHG_03075, partial [Candidatus Saccharimonadales bacterium]